MYEKSYLVGVRFINYGKEQTLCYYKSVITETMSGYPKRTPEIHEGFTHFLLAHRYTLEEAREILLNVIPIAFNKYRDKFPKTIKLSDFRVLRLGVSVVD